MLLCKNFQIILFMLWNFRIPICVMVIQNYKRGNFKSPAKFDWKKIVDEMKMVVLFRRRLTAMP